MSERKSGESGLATTRLPALQFGVGGASRRLLRRELLSSPALDLGEPLLFAFGFDRE